jgi:tRNA-dihydrouridine synthase A
MLPYIERQRAAGVPLLRITRHMSGLFNGLPGARAWRRYLAENACRKDAGPEVVRQAAGLVSSPHARSA